MVSVYSPSHFISSTDGSLPDDVSCVLQTLTAQVSAPEYERTPQFTRSSRNSRARRTNWEKPPPAIPATKLAKREGVGGEIDKLRVLINKVTAKTYDTMSSLIVERLTSLGERVESDNMKVVFRSLVLLASANGFLSDVYARLIAELSEAFPLARDAAIEFANGIGGDVEKVRWADPNREYDLYCEINKENEARRSAVAFAVGLAQRSVIPFSTIRELAALVQAKLTSAMEAKETAPAADELTEIMYTVISSVAKPCDSGFPLEEAREEVHRIASLKARTYPGLTHKTIFKHMDMRDLMERVPAKGIGKVCA